MLGKILVVVHTGLSLCFAALALALYTNRIDWTSREAKAGKPEGLQVGRNRDYETVAAGSVRPAYAQVVALRPVLLYNEQIRPYEQQWYKAQIEFLKSGTVNEKSPIRQVTRGADGGPIVYDRPQQNGDVLEMTDKLHYQDPRDGQVKQFKDRKGENLKLNSQAGYEREYAAADADTDKQVKRVLAAVDRDSAATAKLKGPKGLRKRIDQEEDKRERVEEEVKDLRDLWVDTYQKLGQFEDVRDNRLKPRLLELGGKVDGEGK